MRTVPTPVTPAMVGVFTVIYQRTSGLKHCICSFRNKHRSKQPEPAFLPPKTKEHWWTLSAFATAEKDVT